ncbi:MAG TPA: hypothetical protein PKH37_08845 [Alphaproteobacteria bacterium]|nr:hypothetical protein [Alphaproteobacteria bacterium]
MEQKSGPFLKVTTHQLKNNISRYLRELENETYKAVMVYRHDRVVGVLQSVEALSKRAKAESSGSTGPDGG